MKMKDSGEFGFIDRIRRKLDAHGADVIKGIGDDCAVFKLSAESLRLLTTDILIEDVHFELDLITPFLLGRKSLAVNLSDIAAMGGVPCNALVGLAIPEDTELEFLDKFYEGLSSTASEFEVELAGGDTVFSPAGLFIGVTVDGQVPEDEVLYRSGACVGDVIFLTGTVGSAAAYLDLTGRSRKFDREDALRKAQFDPRPHIKEGRVIAESGLAHALIDVSDGVVADLGHICRESNVGAVIESDKLPRDEALQEYCRQYGLDKSGFALHGGEDYVLMGTVEERSVALLKSKLNSQGCDFFPIGKIEKEMGIRLRSSRGQVTEIENFGYDHFKRR